MTTRAWSEVMLEMGRHGRDSTQDRCQRAFKSVCFDPLRNKSLISTTSADLLSVLNKSGNATQHYLRRLHNLAVNLGWLGWPILAKNLWPKIKSGRRRAITQEEHEKIIASEQNAERKAFYELLWETGCSQSDAASLSNADIDWKNRVLSYHRMKLTEGSTPAMLTIGNRLFNLLQNLPSSGFLFPKLSLQSAKERAAEFRRRCRLVKITDVSLHCYRHSWAQRAKTVGYPHRFAEAALGHRSRAVHEAYAKDAVVVCPSLEAYENAAQQNVVYIATPETAEGETRRAVS